jgi:hypothetical protein
MKRLSVFIVMTLLLSFFCIPSQAAVFDQVISRWTKERRYESKEGANLTVSATYYGAEYIEAYIQSEAQKNLWTESETENFKYNFLGALQLDEMIPVNIKFVNNGPTMHLGPFDVMISLVVGNQTYKPADYDRRFNFSFQGDKEGLVYFRRFDEKSGKDILKGVKSVKINLKTAISPVLDGKEVTFIFDVANDDPAKLYQGKSAARFETDRLLKRLEKLRKDKAEHEKQLQGINEEISTVQKRLDELAKQ